MKNQKRAGILLAYLNTALNMCANLILIPMLIAALTDTQYGIYKVMQSFTGPLIMLNLGLSTIAAGSIAKCRTLQTEQARKDKENTLALAMGLGVLMAALVLLLGGGLTRLLPVVFANTYSAEDLALAERLLMVFVGTTALHIVSDVFRGCILGRERFTFYYGTVTVQYALRFVAIFCLCQWTELGAVAVASVDLCLYALLVLSNMAYCFFVLKERPRLHGIRKKEILSITSFAMAVLLQTIVNQVNSNVDNVILGAMIVDKRVITMYSSALSIFSIYNSLLSVLTNVYFPKAAQLVAADSGDEALTDFVIGPGRIQAVIAVAILGAFGLFGGDFITLWIGEAYIEAWPVALVLMIPVTIPLVQNLCLAILDARLKRLFRSAVLVGMAIMNVAVSILLVSLIGYWGAALGTALSVLLGHGVLMNIYYVRVIRLNVRRMFREIFAGILPAGLLSVAVCLPLAIFLKGSFFAFLGECCVFVAVYGLLLWKLGLRASERQALLDRIKKQK